MRIVLSFSCLLLAFTGASAQTTPSRRPCLATLQAPVARDNLRGYVLCLPVLRARLRSHADSLSDTAETTMSMVDAARFEADSLRPVLYRLAALYPAPGRPTAGVVDSAFQAHMRWLSFVTQPDGEGRSGSMSQIELAMGARATVAQMVVELVGGLLGRDPDFDMPAWVQRWELAGRSRHVAPR